jgi:hypothetical protein
MCIFSQLISPAEGPSIKKREFRRWDTMVGTVGIREGLGRASFGKISTRVLSQPQTRSVATEKRALRGFGARLEGVRKEIDDLRGLLSSARLNQRVTARAAVRSDFLGLSTEASAARRRSGEEVNTSTTSYSPSSANFSGFSTASAEVSGTYDGSLGDQTLTVRVSQGGVVGGLGSIALEISEADGTVVETLTAQDDGQGGEFVQTSFGLEIALDSGLLIADDTIEIGVSASQAPAVDAAAAFDGAGGSNPGFEEGVAVTAGSFTVEGVNIDVFAGDSIDSVLARISDSAAGVTATFDSDAEEVVLSSTATGSAATIDLGADTSGFLAAVKLDNSIFSAGSDNELTANLGSLSEFTGLAVGSFEINGVSISVDPAQDSLEDIVQRIEASAPDIEASFNSATGRLELESASKGGSVELEGDTSGLLDAFGIDAGRVTARRSPEQIEGVDRRRLNQGLEELLEEVAGLFDDDGSSNLRVEQSRLRTKLRSRLDDIFLAAPDGQRDRDGTLSSRLGLELRLGSEVELDEIASFSRGDLEDAFRRDAAALLDFLGDEDSKDGESFIATLEAVVEETADGFVERFGTGVIVSRLA